jgi:hypothetical protein
MPSLVNPLEVFFWGARRERGSLRKIGEVENASRCLFSLFWSPPLPAQPSPQYNQRSGSPTDVMIALASTSAVAAPTPRSGARRLRRAPSTTFGKNRNGGIAGKGWHSYNHVVLCARASKHGSIDDSRCGPCNPSATRGCAQPYAAAVIGGSEGRSRLELDGVTRGGKGLAPTRTPLRQQEKAAEEEEEGVPCSCQRVTHRVWLCRPANSEQPRVASPSWPTPPPPTMAGREEGGATAPTRRRPA